MNSNPLLFPELPSAGEVPFGMLLIFTPGSWPEPPSRMQAQKVTPPAVLQSIEEVPGISTNSTSQNLLNVVQLLEMIGESMPSDLPPRHVIPE